VKVVVEVVVAVVGVEVLVAVVDAMAVLVVVEVIVVSYTNLRHLRWSFRLCSCNIQLTSCLCSVRLLV
jgi:hypothetical protein